MIFLLFIKKEGECKLNISKEKLLNYILKNDIINMDFVQKEIEMNERLKYLEMHKFKIWEGTDKKFHTYLPDKEKGRIPKKRNTLQEIEDLIIQCHCLKL